MRRRSRHETFAGERGPAFRVRGPSRDRGRPTRRPGRRSQRRRRRLARRLPPGRGPTCRTCNKDNTIQYKYCRVITIDGRYFFLLIS